MVVGDEGSGLEGRWHVNLEGGDCLCLEINAADLPLSMSDATQLLSS